MEIDLLEQKEKILNFDLIDKISDGILRVISIIFKPIKWAIEIFVIFGIIIGAMFGLVIGLIAGLGIFIWPIDGAIVYFKGIHWFATTAPHLVNIESHILAAIIVTYIILKCYKLWRES